MSFKARGALVLLLLGHLALTAFLGSRIRELRIRVHDLEFLPEDSAVLAADERIRRIFGSDDRLIIGLESLDRQVTDPVFAKDYRFFVRRLVRHHNVGMLFVDRLYRARVSTEPVSGEPYLLHPPTPSRIAAALEASSSTRKLAVGRSGRTAFAETAALSSGGVSTIERRVREAFADLDRRRPGEYRLHLLGRHVVLNGLGEAILQDLRRILPWSFAVLFAILLLTFRSPFPALVALAEVGMSVTCTLGVSKLLGHDLSLMTALVPVLITVLGIADEIHLFGEFYRLRALHPDRPAAKLAWQAVGNVFFAVTATAFTTALGFFSFLVPDIPALRTFGITAGIGVGFSWLFTTTFVPAVLALVPAGEGPRWTRVPRRLLPSWPFRGAFPILLSAVLLPGVLRLEIDDGWTRNFDPRHTIVREEQWFHEESTGLHPFDLVLERGDGRSWTDPSLLRALEELQQRIDALPWATASLSLIDLVRDRAWELGDATAPRPSIPASRREVERVLHTFLVFNEQVFVRSFLDATGTKARLLAFAAGDDYGTTTRLRHDLKRSVEQVFDGQVTVATGGSAERGRVLIEAVVTSQAQSVSASLLTAFLALGIASRRWRLSLRCIVANAWALALVLGVAGWAGLTLGVASSCFLALGVGAGLDYAIHLAFDPVEGQAGRGSATAVQLRLLANVLAVGTGLSVLALSSNPTIRKLGLLIVLSIVASGYTALVLFRSGSRDQEVVAPHPLLDAAPL